MIIPVRCISCGRPVAHNWEKFQEKVKAGEEVKKALDDLGLNNYCCRALFLTHVDLLREVAKFKR